MSSYQITPEPNGPGLLVTFTGVVTGAIVFSALNEITNAPGFDDLTYRIWDFTHAEDHTLTADDVRNFVMRHYDLSPKARQARIAVVAPSGYFRGVDELFHIFQSVWTSRQSATFETVEDARAWAMHDDAKA